MRIMETTMQMPPYAEVDQALFSGGSAVCAAECHGVLCGILCASGSSDIQGWVRHLFEAQKLIMKRLNLLCCFPINLSLWM